MNRLYAPALRPASITPHGVSTDPACVRLSILGSSAKWNRGQLARELDGKGIPRNFRDLSAARQRSGIKVQPSCRSDGEGRRPPSLGGQPNEELADNSGRRAPCFFHPPSPATK